MKTKPVLELFDEVEYVTEYNLLRLKDWCGGELVPNDETSSYDLVLMVSPGNFRFIHVGNYLIKKPDGTFECLNLEEYREYSFQKKETSASLLYTVKGGEKIC